MTSLAQISLRALKPGHQKIRPRHDLRVRPRARRPGGRWQHPPSWQVQRDDPDISQDEAGLRKLFIQFSFPGRNSEPRIAGVPGLDPRGRRAGLFAQPFVRGGVDNPGFVVAYVVGDGEAETGPLATAWHSGQFLDPVTDGAVLPILHLNRYKISNPTVLARITREKLEQLLRGYGGRPIRRGHEPVLMHEAMAAMLDMAVEQIKKSSRTRASMATSGVRAGR